MGSSNITVFTSITGGKDKLREMKSIKDGAKFVAYMDTPTLSPTWEVKPAYNKFSDPRRNSRIQKILSHQYVDTEYSIYLDGNIKLLCTPKELIEKYLGDYDLAVYKHPTRDCIYDEAIACAKKGLDDVETIIEQAKMYEDSGYGKHKGLCECGIIFRRNTPQVKVFEDAWWSEFCRHSRRDQISFMYAIDKVGLPFNQIPEFFYSAGTSGIRPGIAEIVLHNHQS